VDLEELQSDILSLEEEFMREGDFTTHSVRFGEDELQEIRHRCKDQLTTGTAGGRWRLEEANGLIVTAGHSSMDHFIVWTNDYEADHITELERNLLNCLRIKQPEPVKRYWPRLWREKTSTVVPEIFSSKPNRIHPALSLLMKSMPGKYPHAT
jgi:hypothetical protein